MIKNVRLVNNNALKSVDLKNLGKINIVCGKNNSGKSTILKTFLNANSWGESHKFVQKDIKSLAKNGFQNRTPLKEGSNEYSDFKLNGLTPYLLNKDIFFTDIPQIVKTITNYLSNSYNSVHSPHIQNKIQSFYSIKPNTILIPPKRTLEERTEINFNRKINPGGSGIINNLLFAFNQPEESPLKTAYNKILNAFTLISSGFEFNITIQPNLQVGKTNFSQLQFRNAKDRTWRPASSAGQGLIDLLIILYFTILSDNKLILIEEPENHIHPDMQRKLLQYLKKNTDKQYIISTHSSVFLDLTLVDQVFFTSYNGEISVNEATSRARILSDLGYSVAENLVSDLVILVEGPTDKPVIEELLSKINIWGNYDIKIWPLGGDNMGHLDLSVFSENYNVIGLIDKDPKSRKVRKQFMDNCKANNIKVTKLKKYALENYFTPRIINKIFKHDLEQEIIEIDPKIKLKDQIGIDIKKQNRELARSMNLEELEQTEDLYEFLILIKNLLQNDYIVENS